MVLVLLGDHLCKETIPNHHGFVGWSMGFFVVGWVVEWLVGQLMTNQYYNRSNNKLTLY